jgi:signal transduction histidine kinase
MIQLTITNSTIIILTLIIGGIFIGMFLGCRKTKKKIANEMKFIFGAGHQLRTPLTRIFYLSGMIEDGNFGEISDKIKDQIRIISRSSRELGKIIDDFLAFSNLKHKKKNEIQSNFVIKDLKEILEKTVEDHQILIPKEKQEKLKLLFEIQEDQKNQEFNSRIDEVKIKQIISNLIDNAIKFTESGQITVGIDKLNYSQLSKSKLKDKVIISVKDTGPGISKENLQKLFSEFRQLNSKHKSGNIGAGLGLYIAKEFIKMHNGKIWAKSEGEGSGTTFFVALNLN